MAGLETSELLVHRVKGDADGDGFIVLGQNFMPEERCNQRRHPLLTVDQNSFARGG